jgi:DNA-binding MarR family transcriptional regulator
MKTSDLAAELIVHLARLAQSGAGEGMLTPAQWTALRFFARANRHSRTPSAFSAFHATTRGTASQTVKSLVERGLLARHRSESDGRSIRFDVTEAGLRVLSGDPLHALSSHLDRLPDTARAQFLDTLRTLVGGLADTLEAANFGTCADCAHCEGAAAAPAYCRCMDSVLKAEEMGTLCVDFRPAAPAQPPRLRAAP